jgi:hypothetical protein
MISIRRPAAAAAAAAAGVTRRIRVEYPPGDESRRHRPIEKPLRLPRAVIPRYRRRRDVVPRPRAGDDDDDSVIVVIVVIVDADNVPDPTTGDTTRRR